MCLGIRFNLLQGSHCMLCPYIFSLHLSKIKCQYPGSILTGNLVLQLDAQDWVLAQCQPHRFVISFLAWNSKNPILYVCSISSWYRCLKSLVNVNYNGNFKNFKSHEQVKHWPFSAGGFLGAFCFALVLWRERSSCRISVITSLDQMRDLNVESRGIFSCLCLAHK